MVFKKPDGTTAFTLSSLQIVGDGTAQRQWWAWRSFNQSTLNTANTNLGTWRITLSINSASTGTVVLLDNMPLELRSTRSATFNRAPFTAPAPTAFSVTLEPAAPKATDAVLARINASTALEDADYDIVRYRYIWKRNGQIVRDVTHAGRADAVEAGLLSGGDSVRVEVTAIDTLNAQTAAAPVEAPVAGAACPADVGTEGNPDPLSGPDGFVTGSDFDLYVQAYFSLLQRATGQYVADLTDGEGTGGPDGFVTGTDADYFVIRYFGGC